MTRHVIAFEGKPSSLPDTWLAKGSLRLKKGRKIPVTWNFDWISPPIGLAEKLERNDETGEVSVEITFREDPNVDEELYSYTFAANQLVEEQVPATDEIPAHRLILEAYLLHIAIVPNDTMIPKPSNSRNLQAS